MKKNILPIIALAIMMVFLGACSNSYLEKVEEDVATKPETATTLTLIAEMPDEGPTPRVALAEEGANISVNWKAGDIIQFAVRQGTSDAILAGQYELKQADIEGTYSPKRARFTVTLPTTGFVATDPFTLYGVHGGGDIVDGTFKNISVSGTDVNAVLPKRAFMAVEDNTIGTKENDVMLYFSKIIEPGSQIGKVTFKHLGSIIAIHVKSNRDRNFKGFELTGVDDTGKEVNTHWAYNSYYPAHTNSDANTFNIESGAFSNNGPGWDTSSDNHLHIRKEGVESNRFNIESGKPKIFYAWYPILTKDLDFPITATNTQAYTVSAEWPQLRIDVKALRLALLDYAVTGDNWTAEAKKPNRGKTYHFYAEWNTTVGGTGGIAGRGNIKWVTAF